MKSARLSKKQAAARVVKTAVAKPKRRAAIKAASKKVSGGAAIDFVRSVRN